MLGFIKKDLFMLKSNFKLFIVIIVCLLFFMFNNDENNIETMMIFLPMLGTLMYLSTFSYDEFNNFNAYSCSFKNGKNNYVKGKYITSVIVFITLLLVSIVIALIMKNNIKDILFVCVESILSLSLIVSLLFPFMLKYGAMNGRIIVFVFIMIISAFMYLLNKLISLDKIVNYLNNSSSVVLLLFSMLILFLSYLISNYIYKNKEF